MSESFHLVTYDIRNSKRRTKVCNLMKNYGERVQFSVFECWIDDILRKKMIAGLREIIDKNSDGIRIYRICSGCIKKIDILGTGTVTPNPDFRII